MVARTPVQEPGEQAAGREVEVIPVDIPEVSESEIPVVEPPAVVTPLLNSRISPTYRRVRSRPFPRPLSRSGD